jgi:hypothetical protein
LHKCELLLIHTKYEFGSLLPFAYVSQHISNEFVKFLYTLISPSFW